MRDITFCFQIFNYVSHFFLQIKNDKGKRLFCEEEECFTSRLYGNDL